MEACVSHPAQGRDGPAHGSVLGTYSIFTYSSSILDQEHNSHEQRFLAAAASALLARPGYNPKPPPQRPPTNSTTNIRPPARKRTHKGAAATRGTQAAASGASVPWPLHTIHPAAHRILITALIQVQSLRALCVCIRLLESFDMLQINSAPSPSGKPSELSSLTR